MRWLVKKFTPSDDLQHAWKNTWKKEYVVTFDTFTLITDVMIRCSGDGLTSVGNYAINWIPDQVLPCLMDAYLIATKKLEYVIDTARRASTGQSYKLPEHDFGLGEGDDKLNGYTSVYLCRFKPLSNPRKFRA